MKLPLNYSWKEVCYITGYIADSYYVYQSFHPREIKDVWFKVFIVLFGG